MYDQHSINQPAHLSIPSYPVIHNKVLQHYELQHMRYIDFGDNDRTKRSVLLRISVVLVYVVIIVRSRGHRPCHLPFENECPEGEWF